MTVRLLWRLGIPVLFAIFASVVFPIMNGYENCEDNLICVGETSAHATIAFWCALAIGLVLTIIIDESKKR